MLEGLFLAAGRTTVRERNNDSKAEVWRRFLSRHHVKHLGV